MNPCDPLEFAMLLKTIKKELPFFTKTMVAMKSDHGQFPKNVKKHSTNLNEKFLDHNADIIDEIDHRNKNNNFIQRFKQYEGKYFIADATCLSTASEMVVNSYRFVAACTPISEIESTTSDDGDDQASVDQVIWNHMSTTVTISDCFDQIAIKRGAGSGGSLRMGVYSQQTSAPSALLAETATISMPSASSYTYQSLTETEANTADLWGCFMQSSETPKIRRHNSGDTGFLFFRNSYSFGSATLPNPAAATSSGAMFRQKIGHTS